MTAEKTNEQLDGGGAETENAATKDDEATEAANVPIWRLPRAFVSRRWWWATLLVLALMALLAYRWTLRETGRAVPPSI